MIWIELQLLCIIGQLTCVIFLLSRDNVTVREIIIKEVEKEHAEQEEDH